MGWGRHHACFQRPWWVPVVRLLPLVLIALLAGASAQFQPPSSDWSPFVVREDLAEAGDLDGALRVARFVQVSDAHVLDDDAPAPMRVDALDEVFFGTGVSDGGERPQDEYTDEALDAVIRAINQVHAEDPLDFVISTGDNVDNNLENELMRFLDNWEGTFTPNGPISGFPCQPDGQSASVDDDANDVSDACTHLPDSVRANNTPLVEGLPWFSAFGNHDGLIQGNVPIQPSFQELAADFGRRFLQQQEFVAMHFDGGRACQDGQPAGGLADDFGHGYGFAADRLCDGDPDNDGYYGFSSRGIRFIVLDTVNDSFVTGNENYVGSFNPETTLGSDLVGGYSEGSVDPAQFAWLQQELARFADSLVILMSHHSVDSMFSSKTEGQCTGPNGECLDDLLTAAGYKTGPDLVEFLSQYPNVIAWLGGHRHLNDVQAKGIPGAPSAGFWNIDTSSIIDLPQESRIIELWVTDNGTKGFLALTPFTHDYALSRELAQTDEQFDAELAYGDPEDRQVLLWFDIPAGVSLVAQPSLPKALRMEVLGPVALNGSHGRVGEDLEIRIHAFDPLSPSPLALNASITVMVADPDDQGRVKRVLDGAMQSLGNGTFRANFTPEAPRVHYATIQVQDPSGAYPDLQEMVSLDIAGEPPAEAQKSPGLAMIWAALGVLLLAAGRRSE